MVGLEVDVLSDVGWSFVWERDGVMLRGAIIWAKQARRWGSTNEVV